MFWDEVIPPTIIMTVLFSCIVFGASLISSHFFGNLFMSWRTAIGVVLIIAGVSFILAVFAFSAAHNVVG